MHFSEALRVQREEYLALLQTQFFMLDMFSQLLPHVSHCFSDEDVGGVTDRERLQMYALERQLALGAVRNDSYDLNDLPAIKRVDTDAAVFRNVSLATVAALNPDDEGLVPGTLRPWRTPGAGTL